MSSQYSINPWGGTQNYQQYDVIYGINVGVNIYPSAYYYATQANTNQNPSGIFGYTITSIASSEDVVTIYYNQTGSGPSVAPGSIIAVTGTLGTNYTGMALGGGSGYASYILPGFAATVAGAGAVVMPNAAWTTGFAFIPSYATKIQTQNKPIVTQLGNGYSQQMGRGLNNFDQGATWVFENIDKRQMKAITHFVQDAAGVWPFEVLMPDQYLNNQPKQKFFGDSVEVDPVSFQRYNVSVALRRSYNP